MATIRFSRLISDAWGTQESRRACNTVQIYAADTSAITYTVSELNKLLLSHTRHFSLMLLYIKKTLKRGVFSNALNYEMCNGKN